MKNYKNAFTLVELVIVITMLVTLSTISIVSYIGSLADSRNATRVAELSNLKIGLKNHKIKNANYPFPWNFFAIQYGAGNEIIKQWFMNNDVAIVDVVKKPTDPFITNQYYVYSITQNRLFFQLAATLEKNDDELLAILEWDYQTKSIWTLPSLIVATWSSIDVATHSGKFVVHNGMLNLPYDLEGKPYSSATSYDENLSQSAVEIPKFFWYASCSEIYENGWFFGTWKYQVTDVNNWVVICAQCAWTITVSTGVFLNNKCQ